MTSIHTPSPKSPENEKSKRYDRQLRLWGENGQQALETSHVCLINANIVGTEILKNLVLPGIRAFTIIDDQIVTEDDTDGNFFLCADGSIGQSRAKIAANFLLEMNDDVKKGDYLEENFESLLDKDAHYFNNFNLVIACGIKDERSLNKLSKEMWSLNIPLLVIKSIGYFGYIRLQVAEHNVIEPHPDNTIEDLRLAKLFPTLKSYFDSFAPFEDLSRQELSRVPSLVIIYKNLLKWRKENQKNDNEIPKDYKEKSELISLIKTEMNQLKELNIIKDEESNDEIALELDNFEEAIKLVKKIFGYNPPIPPKLQELLDEAQKIDCSTLKKTSNIKFWTMLKGLNEFIARYDCLPLKGSIYDMNSGSEQYIQLQKIYKSKAKEDVNLLHKIIMDSWKNFNISENELELFCKNVRDITLVRTSAMYQEINSKSMRELTSSKLQNGTDEEGSDSDELRIYILMRLIDRFYSKHQRFPGENDDEVDVAELKKEFKDFCNDLGCNTVIKDELIHEICRYGGCELHSISAFLGGCAAQEAIKLITGQYIPIDNTFVYNAITCKTSTFKF